MPNYSGFYNPNQYSWAMPWRFDESPVGQEYLNNTNRQAGWTRYLAQKGYGGTDNRNDWARSLYSRAGAGYEAALGDDPELKWTDFMKNLDLDQIYANQSNEARGISPQRFVQPPRWLMR